MLNVFESDISIALFKIKDLRPSTFDSFFSFFFFLFFSLLIGLNLFQQFDRLKYRTLNKTAKDNKKKQRNMFIF